jgi:hypothetical protein
MVSESSPQGRRVLVAVVNGTVGAVIQKWREENDPAEAVRLPPHATLCYWAPVADPGLIAKQIRHAFPAPVTVQLGRVQQADNHDQTFFVQVLETAALDAARDRLLDGTYLDLPGKERLWQWHVTCVRRSFNRDQAALREQAKSLVLDVPWTVDTIAYLELQGDRYVELYRWRL